VGRPVHEAAHNAITDRVRLTGPRRDYRALDKGGGFEWSIVVEPGVNVPLMGRWTKPPLLFVYVLVVGGVLAAITTALLGDDGVDWPLTILITLGLLVGTVIGQLIKTHRAA
jgi:hypothetical protein